VSSPPCANLCQKGHRSDEVDRDFWTGYLFERRPGQPQWHEALRPEFGKGGYNYSLRAFRNGFRPARVRINIDEDDQVFREAIRRAKVSDDGRLVTSYVGKRKALIALRPGRYSSDTGVAGRQQDREWMVAERDYESARAAYRSAQAAHQSARTEHGSATERLEQAKKDKAYNELQRDFWTHHPARTNHPSAFQFRTGYTALSWGSADAVINAQQALRTAEQSVRTTEQALTRAKQRHHEYRQRFRDLGAELE